MAENPLGAALSALKAPTKAEPNPYWAQFGLPSNPFPSNRTIWPQVLYGQEEAIQGFTTAVGGVLGPVPEKRALAVIGATGGGKTHFLRACEFEFEKEVVKKQHRSFLIVEVTAGSGTVVEIVRRIFDRADSFCQATGEADFSTALIRRAAASGANGTSRLTGDIRTALSHLAEAAKPGYVPKDMYGTYDFEKLREVFSRWISGGPLSQTEQKYLGVLGRVRTGSYAVRILHELLGLARDFSILEGVLLCIDEFETLFRSGASLGQIQSFLQDLRYLHDDAARDGKGFSLLLLTASTTTGALALQTQSLPLFHRLGYEPSRRVLLTEISSVVQARDLAYKYIDTLSAGWQAEHKSKPRSPPRSVLSESEIEEAFVRAGGKPGTSLAMGSLLDALHQAAEAKMQARQSET